MKSILSLAATLLFLAGLFVAPRLAHAAAAYGNCTGFVDALPAYIEQPGTWCLRRDLQIASANLYAEQTYINYAVRVAAHDVTLDCNGHSITLIDTPSDQIGTFGVYTQRVRSTVIRRCAVRGPFRASIGLGKDSQNMAIRPLVEDNTITGSAKWGIIGYVATRGHGIIRRNRIADFAPFATGSVAGIEANGSYEIIDNVVENLRTPKGSAVTGIHVDWSEILDQDIRATVRGNRIRGLYGLDGRGTTGISIGGEGIVVVDGNDILGDMVIPWDLRSLGIYCSGNVRLRDSVISGFQDTTFNCVDLGNDLTN